MTGSHQGVALRLSAERFDARVHPEHPPIAVRLADRVARRHSWPHTATAIAVATVLAYLVLAAALVAAGLVIVHALPGVDRWDDHTSRSLASARTPFWDRISYWGTFIANTLGVVVVAVVASLILLVRRCGRWAALLACGLTLELVTFLTANYLVRRPRPSVPHLGSTPSTFSFPSGHAAATLVLYGGIAVLVSSRTRNRAALVVAWTAAVLLPAWVAFSRVYRGQHHATDVLAGLSMGLAALVASVRAIRAVPDDSIGVEP